MIEQTYAHVVPQVTPDLSFANMGRKWGGLGRFTPNGVTDESREVVDDTEETSGDPGAIRTRDPQLRRLGGQSRFPSNVCQLQTSCPAGKWAECR